MPFDSGINSQEKEIKAKFNIPVRRGSINKKTIFIRYYSIVVYENETFEVETFYPYLVHKYLVEDFDISPSEISRRDFNIMRSKIIISKKEKFNLFRFSTWLPKIKSSAYFKTSTSPLFSNDLKDWHTEILARIKAEKDGENFPDFFDEPEVLWKELRKVG